MAKINTNPELIENILTRGVEDIFIYDSLKSRLSSGKQLRIKFGIDPTGPKIHLGRASVLRKLKSFQDLGHQIVLIVGDFTAQIGDPSDKLGKRPMLTSKIIKENLKNYLQAIGKIIDIKKTQVYYNSKWLGKLGFQEIAELAESFSVQQMSNRRNFKERLDRGEEVSLREFMYPLMQGYDSVIVKSDVEIGGFDQLFNIKAGRTIQKHYGQPEQDVMTVQMLEGTDGRKMSTSWGNVINITDEPKEMFGKIMSMRDELIGKYFLLCTDKPANEIKETEERIKSGGLNPRDAKLDLAQEIVRIYHGEKEAAEARQNFISTFQRKEVPEEMPEISVSENENLGDTLVAAGILKSKSEWRRLVGEGAVTLAENGEKISDPLIKAKEETYKIGKRKFVRVIKK